MKRKQKMRPPMSWRRYLRVTIITKEYCCCTDIRILKLNNSIPFSRSVAPSRLRSPPLSIYFIALFSFIPLPKGINFESALSFLLHFIFFFFQFWENWKAQTVDSCNLHNLHARILIHTIFEVNTVVEKCPGYRGCRVRTPDTMGFVRHTMANGLGDRFSPFDRTDLYSYQPKNPTTVNFPF